MKSLKILGLFLLTLLGTSAHADFYLGAGGYATALNAPSDADNLDDTDFAPAFFLGWRPIELVGVEAGYYDFGEFEGDSGSIEGKAMTLAGLLSLELGPIGVYAKGGVADTELEGDLLGQSIDESSTDPFGGLGMTVDILDKVYVYAEALRFAAEEDVDMVGAGLRYSF